MNTFLPSVIRAEYQDKFRIHLTFNDNTKKIVDFSQWIDGPIFEPLKDVEYFRRFYLEGGTVAWPNGADIAPETLYHASAAEPQPARKSKPQPGSRAVRS
jgi:hypothetical protein